jgi:serine phosphatase RsbU (regulator of sigma subunit)/GAF domain-containing protein
MPEETATPIPIEPRHPRLLHAMHWFQRHALLTIVVSAAIMAGVFAFDLFASPQWIAGGFYLVPLALIALTLRRRTIVAAGVAAIVLSATVMLTQHVFANLQHLVYLYLLIVATGALVVLSNLLAQLDEVSSRALVRARLAQAEADVVGQSSRRGEPRELVDSAVRRIGGELEADVGVAFVVRDWQWCGEAAFGSESDPHTLCYPYEALVVLRHALDNNEVLSIPDVRAWFAQRSLTPPSYLRDFELECVLVVPMRAFEVGVGAMVFSRPSASGPFTAEQVRFAGSVGGHVAVALENGRLVAELDVRQRDLSLVVESSLDFASSLEPHTVIEAVVERLVTLLGVSGCDIHVLEPGADAVRTVVSYDNGRFDFGDVIGRLWSLADYAATARVIETGHTVAIMSRDDPSLSDHERRLLVKNGKTSQLGVPLKVRDRVIGVVELFDDKASRTYSPADIGLVEAICQFAALALDNAHLYESQRDSAERLERIAAQLATLQQVSLKVARLRDEASVVREVLESGTELLDADIAAYAVRDGEVVAVRGFHDRHGFSAPDAAAADSIVAVLRDGFPTIGATEIGDGVAQQTLADHAFVHGRVLIVPLRRRRTDAFAALVFQRSRDGASGNVFDDDDGRLATTLAAQLSLTLRNVHAFQREHEIAETFQQALLVEPPLLAGAEIGVKYQAAARAARVGGDFYDILQVAPGRVLIAVGDVCGRGLQAAVETALLRYTLRAYAQESSPGEALSRLNSALLAQDPDLPFATVVLASLDVGRRNLEYAVAGHPRPMVLVGRRRFAVAQAGGFPVSMFPGESYPTHRCVLPEGATIVLYTDGLTEARRGSRMLGERGLRETLRRHLDEPAQQLAESLMDRAARYAGGSAEDDMAVVVIKLP